MTLRAVLSLSSFALAFWSDGEGFAGNAGSPAIAANDWVEQGSHRVRLDDVRACGAVTVNGQVSAFNSTDSRDSAPLLGFLVRIEARTKEFAVSPRDLTLEAGGVVLDAVLARPEGRWRCVPALPYTRLESGREARGYVFFRVTPGFRASAAPIVLVYKPTRWGGSARATISVPRCLESCAPPVPIAEPGKRRPPFN